VNWIARRKSDQNLAVVDPWTFVHAGTGLALGLLNVPMWKAVTGAVLYEVIEARAETKEAGRRFFSVSSPEIVENQILDVAIFALGVHLGRRWNES
jgi:hypothetical protein